MRSGFLGGNSCGEPGTAWARRAGSRGVHLCGALRSLLPWGPRVRLWSWSQERRGKSARLLSGAAWGYSITARQGLTLESSENSLPSRKEEPGGRGPRGGTLVSRGGKAQLLAKALTSSELLRSLAGSSRPCRTWQTPTSAPISSPTPIKSPPSGSPIHLTLQNLSLLPTPFCNTPELRVPLTEFDFCFYFSLASSSAPSSD